MRNDYNGMMGAVVQPGHEAEIDPARDASSATVRARAAGLIRDGRVKDAAVLLAHGRRLLPDDVDILLDEASLAETMDDLDGAVELLETAIDRHPATEAAYLRAGVLYRRIGRPHQAETVLLEGMCWCPSGLDLFVEHAAIAMDRHDWRQAARRYRLMRDRFPALIWTHAHLATALRKAARLSEAEEVLLEGHRHFSHDRHFLVEYAEVAADREDWAEAARRFKDARQRFPDFWWTCKRNADVLTRAGSIAEAETLLFEAQRLAPEIPLPFLDHAELAFERRDWAESLRRFAAVRARFPGEWWSYKRIADTLRATGRNDEAEAVLVEAQQLAPEIPVLFVDHAELAFERWDWTEGLRRFEIVRTRFPTEGRLHGWIAAALRASGRTDEAEAALLEAQQRAPDEPALFVVHAEMAFDRRDWAEGLRRFEIVRDRFPAEGRPHGRIAAALRTIGRIGEAEAVLLDGQCQHPQDLQLVLDHAELAGARQDWEEALRRFESARVKFPGVWPPLRGIAQAHGAMGRFDDEDRVIREGMELFPDELEIFIRHAKLAQWLGRPEEGIERYRLAHRRFPHDHECYFQLACSFIGVRRLDEAESMLLEVIKVFPHERQALIELVNLTIEIQADVRQTPIATLEHMVDGWIERCGDAEDLLLAKAKLAQIKGDYQGYLQWLLKVAQAYPDAKAIVEKVAAARELLIGQGEAVPDVFGDIVASPSGSEGVSHARRTLLSLFESLGGGGPGGITLFGCEFGFVQRKVSLEPLSLLRWTGVNLANVTRLLADDFAGIGEPGNCTLTTVDDQYDWNIVDTAYDLRNDHTHLDKLTVPPAEAIRMMCQRTRFLVRKLREDLEDGEKIFVYRYLGPLEDEAAMLALADAVNKYGRNMLFFVCRADEHHAPFTVRLVRPGLMVGHIDWFAPERYHYPANLDGWTRLCEDAHRIWQAQRAQVGTDGTVS